MLLEGEDTSSEDKEQQQQDDPAFKSLSPIIHTTSTMGTTAINISGVSSYVSSLTAETTAVAGSG
jgi:hypothetical protein